MSFQVHNDMTAPLAQYFIYTGHNSYLTGNQLSSDCSEVPIVKALQRGVRVIELDLWPGSAKDEILVLHGRYILIAILPFLRMSVLSFAFMYLWICISTTLYMDGSICEAEAFL